MEEAGALLAGQAGGQVDDSLAGKAVDSAELEDCLAVRELDIFAVHLNEGAGLLDR
jgi:hypothetical protein